MKKMIVQVILYAVLVVGFWNLFDFLYVKFISKGEFEFSWVSNIIIPFAIGLAVGVFDYLFNKKLKKDKE